VDELYFRNGWAQQALERYSRRWAHQVASVATGRVVASWSTLTTFQDYGLPTTNGPATIVVSTGTAHDESPQPGRSVTGMEGAREHAQLNVVPLRSVWHGSWVVGHARGVNRGFAPGGASDIKAIHESRAVWRQVDGRGLYGRV
jgi:hypothetical protein